MVVANLSRRFGPSFLCAGTLRLRQQPVKPLFDYMDCLTRAIFHDPAGSAVTCEALEVEQDFERLTRRWCSACGERLSHRRLHRCDPTWGRQR